MITQKIATPPKTFVTWKNRASLQMPGDARTDVRNLLKSYSLDDHFSKHWTITREGLLGEAAEQIAAELVTNAVRATPEGVISFALGLDHGESGGRPFRCLDISVWDSARRRLPVIKKPKIECVDDLDNLDLSERIGGWGIPMILSYVGMGNLHVYPTYRPSPIGKSVLARLYY